MALEGETVYLELLRQVLHEGESRVTRNGSTISSFAKTLRFDLQKGFPLLTTKKMFFRGIVEELCWFLRGSTNATELEAKGISIWKANSSKEYLTKVGLPDYEEGDIGPAYGFQWRHWGAPYEGMKADYEGKGVDQIAKLIETIRTTPYDRRMIISAWNVSQLSEMALPPCHMMYQFYCSGPNASELSCMMTQRSADLFLGLPFNIASTALLTHIIAAATGKVAKEIQISIGDAHIYFEHREAVEQQLNNPILDPPKLVIKNIQRLDQYGWEDFELNGYRSADPIIAPMLA